MSNIEWYIQISSPQRQRYIHFIVKSLNLKTESKEQMFITHQNPSKSGVIHQKWIESEKLKLETKCMKLDACVCAYVQIECGNFIDIVNIILRTMAGAWMDHRNVILAFPLSLVYISLFFCKLIKIKWIIMMSIILALLFSSNGCHKCVIGCFHFIWTCPSRFAFFLF